MSREVVVETRTTEVVVENRPTEVLVETTLQEVVIDRKPTEVLVETAVTEVIVEQLGARGLPGPPGSGAAYVHTQASPAATWTVNHNMGFRPSIELIDASGAEFDGEIIHTSANQAMVYLDEATAGLARCN